MVDGGGGPSDLALCAIILEKRSQGWQRGGFRAPLFSARMGVSVYWGGVHPDRSLCGGGV